MIRSQNIIVEEIVLKDRYLKAKELAVVTKVGFMYYVHTVFLKYQGALNARIAFQSLHFPTYIRMWGDPVVYIFLYKNLVTKDDGLSIVPHTRCGY